jgi:nucleoside-diphosphate-sugar epimerase
MKVAITGASGYLGGRIADAFRRHGHEVLSLSRRPCPDPWLSYSLGDDPDRLPWNGIEVLVHAAYDFNAGTLEEIIEKNVRPGVALFHSASRAGVGRLLFISSMSCFDGCRSNYGKAKHLIEKEAHALGAHVIRPGLVWGEHSGGIMGTLELLVKKLPIVPYLAGGNLLKQYLVHDEDLAETVVALACKPSSGNGTPHTVAHPSPVPFPAILKTIANRAGRRPLFLPVPWQPVMLMLKLIEATGIRFPFRSDSLVGLVHSNPSPDFTEPLAGVRYRTFQNSR